MKIYHGTSYENAQNILRNGWDTLTYPKTWTVSATNHIYFYYDRDDEGEDETRDIQLMRQALESAMITAALHHSSSKDLCVFCVDLDLTEDEITSLKDCSCPGMDDVALEVPIWMLRGKTFEYRIFENVFIPSATLLYLASLNFDYLHIELLNQEEKSLLEFSKYNTKLYEVQEYLLGYAHIYKDVEVQKVKIPYIKEKKYKLRPIDVSIQTTIDDFL